ncbi:MAG TPA: TIR domain-containing protein [Sedimentisphaerales bacterium]|nr:TIR domain-containing protein [Sedimentisphaerales bacterium]
MGLPVRTTQRDIEEVLGYLANKPTGATIKEAKAVLDAKRLDARKLSALSSWGLIEKRGERLTLTGDGREFGKSDERRVKVLRKVIRNTPAYFAMVERAAIRQEDSLTATDVAAHWHEHFPEEVGDNDKVLKEQAVCFFQVADGAKLGTLVLGRKGAQTRFSFSVEPLDEFIGRKGVGAGAVGEEERAGGEGRGPQELREEGETPISEKVYESGQLGQGIFVGHGKNKKALEQLKKILDQFRIPYKVAIDEPNLGRPISGKIREIMKSCNCAILIFTADEEFRTKSDEVVWRPSENVVYELGASGYLYDNRIVIMKEEGVDFPSNFRDLGYISFEKGKLEAKAMDILKELIGFAIVKVST